jgi:hypothetical protein
VTALQSQDGSPQTTVFMVASVNHPTRSVAAVDDRNQQILTQRLGGDTLQQVADRHDLSRQGVRAIVIREGRRQIDALELALMANRKTGDVELFAIPDHSGPDFDLAVDYFQWCVRELAKRGVQTQVHYRPTNSGVAFGIEDVTNYGRSQA